MMLPIDVGARRGGAVCSRCKRPLSDPISVKMGIGPICRGYGGGLGRRNGNGGNQMSLEEAREFHDFPIAQPIAEGIILRRDGDRMESGSTVFMNVPHLTVWHSPNGFEWGYGGSGPADLALNIVEAVLKEIGYDGPRMICWEDWTCFSLAGRLHQDFKWEFIGGMPEEGGEISFENITDWIEQHNDDELQRWYTSLTEAV